VAVAAEVQLDDVPQADGGRVTSALLEEPRSLYVREGPELSQNTLDQPARASTGQLQLDVVVEFQREDIDIGQVAGERRLPGPQVGDITDGPVRSRGTRFGFDPKSKRRAPVMLEGQRPAAGPRNW